MSKERDAELAEIGKKLAKAESKEALMTLLPKAATMLEEVEQSPPPNTILAMKGCSDALVDPALLGHKDKDVGLLVALCISEIMRIVAPDAPYSDDCLKEIFQLIVDIFRGLDDVHSPSFSSRVNILETVAKVRSCVVMLDLECDDLITEMFEIFFTTASDKHPEHVFLAMQNVLSLVIEEGEEVSSQILEIILNNLLRHKEGASEAGHKLAVAVVDNCAENLEPYVRRFLTLVLLEGGGVQTGLKKEYHEIIYEIYSCAPQMLLAVLPYLKEELVSNQVIVRLNSTTLLGRMFVLPDRQVAPGYQQLFSDFLKRLNDEDVDVQRAAVNCAKSCLETMNSSAAETSEILVALGDQLCRFDDGVRTAAMDIICDFARTNPNLSPPGILRKVGDCLQDTKVSIGKETILKLAGVYRSYCAKCFKGFKAVPDEFEWIPGKILLYRKGRADFKLLDMEIVISEELFDADLPVEEQAKHWTVFFSTFDEQDKIALQHILSQKQRLQSEMLVYLSEQRTAKEKDTPDFQKRLQSIFARIAEHFVDPKKAEEDLNKLHTLSDIDAFDELSTLLDPSTTTARARTVREELLKKIGENHPQHDFLKVLATKCAYSVFGREHADAFMQEILVNKKNSATKEKTISTLDLLAEIAAYCPAIVEDVKEKLQSLSKDDEELIRKGVLNIITKAGSSEESRVQEDSGDILHQKSLQQGQGVSDGEVLSEDQKQAVNEANHKGGKYDNDDEVPAKGASGIDTTLSGKDTVEDEEKEQEEEENIPAAKQKRGRPKGSVKKPSSSSMKNGGKTTGPPKQMSTTSVDMHGEMEQDKNLPAQLECGPPEGGSDKKDGSEVLKEAEKYGAEEREEYEVKNIEEEEDGMNSHEKDVVKDVEDVMNAGKQDVVQEHKDAMHDHELQVHMKEKVLEIKEGEVQCDVVAEAKGHENEEANIAEEDIAKLGQWDGTKDEEDEIKAHTVVDKAENPEQEARDQEKDGEKDQEMRDQEKDKEKDTAQPHEEREATGHEVEGRREEPAAKDGMRDQLEYCTENATTSNDGQGLKKNSEEDAVKDLVEDDRCEDGFQDPYKGEVEEKPAGLEDVDGKTLDGAQEKNDADDSKADAQKEDEKMFDGARKENDTDDSKADDQKEHVEDDRMEVTVEGTDTAVLDNWDADEANKDKDDEKGLRQKEEDAGVDHADRAEGHKQDGVDDQVEEEMKDQEETRVKDKKEESRDEQGDDVEHLVSQKPDTQKDDGEAEDEGLVSQKPDTQKDDGEAEDEGLVSQKLDTQKDDGDAEDEGLVSQKPDTQKDDGEAEQDEDKEKPQKSDAGEVEDEDGGREDQQVHLSVKQKLGRPKGSGRKPKRRHSSRGSGKKDAKVVVALEVEKEGQMDPESTAGKNSEAGGEEETPQKLPLKETEEKKKDQEQSLHTKRKRRHANSVGVVNAGVMPGNEMDGETEAAKETTEKDGQDRDENLPAKRTRLPKGSGSKNDAAGELSSKDKKDEEEGGDDQDVEPTPQQSDIKEGEKDSVENLSTKREPRQSKRKLSAGDGKAHKSFEENVDPKRNRGQKTENSSKKGEVFDEDVNDGKNQQELDVTPKSKHRSPKSSVDKGIKYVLNSHDKDADMDVEENLTPKSKSGRAKAASGKKEIRRVSSRDGKGRGTEGGQAAKRKSGRLKGSGGKDITYPSGGDDEEAGEKDVETNVFTRQKPGQPKGTTIDKAVREVSGGDEKATLSVQKSPAWKMAADRGGDEELVGCGIKVWWPLDRRFYKGEVISYNAKKKRHKVLYDDGDQEILNLAEERWELITKKQSSAKNAADGSSTPAWAPVPLLEITKAKSLAQQEDVQRPSEQSKKRSSSKSGKKSASKEVKSDNSEVKFLEATSPVKTISAFDFDEDDDDGEVLKSGKTKRKQAKSSSTPKGSSGKIFKLVSTEKTRVKNSEGGAAAHSADALGDGEPLKTWVIKRQKAH